MFPRIITTIQNGRTYKYLRLVENYRKNNKIKQKTLYSFGAITNPAVRRAIDALLSKLRKYSSRGFFTPEELSTESAQLFGQPLLYKTVWDKLEISKAIKSFTYDRKVEFDITIYILVLTLNHLIAPKSDLALSRWYKQIYLEELKDKELFWYNFYRALDYLYDIKERLEKYLFNKLSDLFSLKVNIVFYDLTTTYFEGDGPEIALKGHSKDNKPGCNQILLALIITEDGFPIAHEIWPGSKAEVTTLSKALDDLSKRFQIGRCILVCDRGLVSKNTLKDIKEHKYQFIVAIKSRNKETLKIVDPDLSNYKKINENIFAKEINIDGKRFILYHNEERAKQNEKERTELLLRLTNSLTNLMNSCERREIKDQKELIRVC